jgi:hypothetical protein
MLKSCYRKYTEFLECKEYNLFGILIIYSGGERKKVAFADPPNSDDLITKDLCISEVFHNFDGLKFSLVTTQWHLLIQKASNINGKLALPALPEIRTRNLVK